MDTMGTYTVVADNVPAKVEIVKKEDEYVPIYDIRFPTVEPATQAVLDSLKERLIEIVKIEISEILDPKAMEEIKNRFLDSAKTAISQELPAINEKEKNILAGMLVHEMLGLGRLELILNDDNLEEVVINNSSESVWVFHKKFGWLKTNVTIPTEEQIYNYASLIGRKVGRQITNLNPLMDAHLTTGDRVNATLFPISTKGNTITIRKFRREPWTIVHFIDPVQKTMTKEIAALLWLCIQYELNILVAGGTASGKTSILNALMPFIPPNHRILSIEDSVSGDEEILVKKKGKIERTKIKDLIDKEIEKSCTVVNGAEIASSDIEIMSSNKDGFIDFKKPSSLIRHLVKKNMYEISLASGRKIKVTADHSLFGLSNGCELSDVKVSGIKAGDFVATARRFNLNGDVSTIDLTSRLKDLEGLYVDGDILKTILREYACRNFLIKNIPTKNRSRRSSYRNKGFLPINLFEKLLKIRSLKDEEKCQLRITSKIKKSSIPLMLKITNDMAFLLGNWIADGCYDRNSVIISADDSESRKIIKNVAREFGINISLHSDGISYVLNSSALKKIMKSMDFVGNSYTKRIPEIVLSFKKELQAEFLKGIFSGDGCVKKNEITIGLASLDLIKDLQTMLLNFEILLRYRENKRDDNCYEARISGVKFLKEFLDKIGFTQNYKMKNLINISNKEYHEVSDIIPLPTGIYRDLKYFIRDELTYKSWKSWQGKYERGMHIGREHLQRIVNKMPTDGGSNLFTLVNNDVFWDRVIEITRIPWNGYVYDFSVPENESFVCNNIIAHNTRELRLPDFLHWIPLTTREPNPEGKGEVSMLDLLVNSLRMRPDRIVVGEIRRQREAEVLFEAMHTGHSVYATLHADRAEQVIRRLTNPPIDVPESLLESLHLVIVQYRHRRLGIRRTLEVAEFIPGESGKFSSRLEILYRWKPSTDTIEKARSSIRLINEIRLHTGMTDDQMETDLKEKENILQWMLDNNVRTVNTVGKVVAEYYHDRDKVLKIVKSKGKPETVIGEEFAEELRTAV